MAYSIALLLEALRRFGESPEQHEERHYDPSVKEIQHNHLATNGPSLFLDRP
jgi:hypothetical protein